MRPIGGGRDWRSYDMSDEGKQAECQKEFQDGPMDQYAVRLTAWHGLVAREAGGGNVSRGVRLALEAWAKMRGKVRKR